MSTDRAPSDGQDIVADAEAWLMDAPDPIHDAAGEIVQVLKNEVKRLRAALTARRARGSTVSEARHTRTATSGLLRFGGLSRRRAT